MDIILFIPHQHKTTVEAPPLRPAPPFHPGPAPQARPTLPPWPRPSGLTRPQPGPALTPPPGPFPPCTQHTCHELKWSGNGWDGLSSVGCTPEPSQPWVCTGLSRGSEAPSLVQTQTLWRWAGVQL